MLLTFRDSNPVKSSDFYNQELKMSNLPVDRNADYMRQMWGTSKLITDYGATPSTRIIQEVMHDIAPKHDLKRQTDLHEKIRNDEDYDDWSYGTEPTYGKKW